MRQVDPAAGPGPAAGAPAGAVQLDGRALQSIPTRELAQRLGILPQGPVAPEGLTVIDLVGRGRSPHQTWWRQWSPADEQAVHEALRATGMTDLADRPVDELSGGQRQRAWIAMALAQGTPVLLLDEPTTYLDLAHQIDVLDLITDLNRQRGPHRRHGAARPQPGLPVRRPRRRHEGRRGSSPRARRRRSSPPSTVEDVFGLRCQVTTDPVSGTPMVIPMGRHHDVVDAGPRADADAGADADAVDEAGADADAVAVTGSAG